MMWGETKITSRVSRRFELPRVKLQWLYEENPGEIDFGSSLREFRVNEGSSHISWWVQVL